ncbi:hypothetical protein M407DRAFT_80394 [Tulasnella calospora MUT 4182]|uniref:DUF1479-domain-containing protein n=1 Tax=Tulasnella calospora MUT 4182 TaxID=1051891 RepID=A0A0C3LJ29_9AGAM|nr:hypothetical protein M407DRAFT_80394 [Tulasnella calospora MUT 4182]
MSSVGGKAEGDISAIFASLSGASHDALPQRFADLKKAIVGTSHEAHQKLTESWVDLLAELQIGLQEIQRKGPSIIPEVSFKELTESGGSATWIKEVAKRGVVVVRDVVPDEEALAWKQQVRDYIKANPQVKGFPADDKQVFEIYWSKSQVQARSHPNVIGAQKAIMSKLFRADPSASLSLKSPVSYVDRLRIRKPGDGKFALGPHIDGGSLERWEDGRYRNCYREILSGNWREHDPYDVGRRLGVNSDMYNGPNQCSVFRAFQGWLALSSTGPSEGTLRVFPLLKEASAYVLLRPFFRPTLPTTDPNYLSADSWTIDVESTNFPNSFMAGAQELNDLTHPHLRLDDGGVVSVKKVEPGDVVFWHCDEIHAVERVHRGEGDSSVFYIPAAPLTAKTAEYLKRQKDVFLQGVPPPDFPGGAGENGFKGVGTSNDILTEEGRKALGFAPFSLKDGMTKSEEAVTKEANSILGF